VAVRRTTADEENLAGGQILVVELMLRHFCHLVASITFGLCWPEVWGTQSFLCYFCEFKGVLRQNSDFVAKVLIFQWTSAIVEYSIYQMILQ
jgi:hypothetical protein